jgi:hypothetical protein
MPGFQREQDTNDFSIQSYNFGGLNTTASRLNVPFQDATELLNVNVGLDGSLAKRRGTALLNGPVTGVGYGVGFRSVLGYNYSVVANNTTLTVYARTDDIYTTLRTFSGVYSTSSNPQATQWVQLPDTYSRVLALRGDRPPVEVYTLEQRFTGVTLSSTNILAITGKFTGEHTSTTPATFMDTLYITRGDGTRITIPGGTLTYTYSSGTTTVTLPFTTLAAEVVSYDIVGFRWAHWAESLKWQGDRYYDTLSRFNVTATDNNVEIPAQLRSDLILGEESLVHLISRTSVPSGLYTLTTQPTTADEYNLSDGAVYVPGVNNYIQKAPYYITFGSSRTPLPQPAESVKFIRFRELRFRQQRTIQGSSLRVTVNDVPVIQNTTGLTAGTNQYVLIDSTGVSCTSTSQFGKWLGFTGSDPWGVGATDIITMTNVDTANNPSGLTVEVEESLFKSGAYRRCYGLGLFTTYTVNGSYPSVGCVYQGRLVLSGVNTDKSRIFFSSIDSTEDRYSYFQITDDLEGLATDPFDVVVSGGDSADYIVGMVEWNSSLFALTRRSVYRVSGGDQPLTATRRLVTYISNIGLVNPRCITRTDTAVYYLSDGGVFNLTPRVEDSEFTAIEKSLKVRDLVLQRNADHLVSSACMFFDSRQRRLYVSLPNTNDSNYEASDVLVLDTVRDAWSQYKRLGQFRVQSMYENVDNGTGKYDIVFATRDGNVLVDSTSRYTDMTTRYTGNTSYTHSITVGYGVPSVQETQRYDIPRGIQTSTIGQVRDIRVFVGTTANPTEVTFTKYRDYVYLDVPVSSGSTVWFVARSTVADSPQGALRYNNVTDPYPYTLWKGDLVITSTSETLVFNTTTSIATLEVQFTGLTSDVFLIGTHYLSVYTSAMFTQQSLGTLKRTKYAYLYFNNTETSNFTVDDTVEQYKTRINVNIAMLYDSNDNDSNTSVDIYGYQDIVWDNAYFDTVESNYRQEPYTLFKEPLIGVGYSYRLGVYSYDDARWNLVGYQIDASQSKGLRYINSD